MTGRTTINYLACPFTICLMFFQVVSNFSHVISLGTTRMGQWVISAAGLRRRHSLPSWTSLGVGGVGWRQRPRMRASLTSGMDNLFYAASPPLPFQMVMKPKEGASNQILGRPDR